MAKNDGGPAFPVTAKEADYNFMGRDCEGLSIRDYFAAMALQGLLASPGAHACDAQEAYRLADAMLAERDK